MEVVWEKGTALPVELEGFSCVSVAGTGIFAFGGLNPEGIEQNQVWHFSPTNDSWRQLKSSINAPEARSNCGLAARSEGGKVALYVFGGLNCDQGWLSSVWKGIVEADKISWSEIKHDGSDFTARDKIAICSDEKNENLFLIGGFGPVEDVESEDEDETEPEDIRNQRQEQKAMSLGWFDEVLKFNFESNSFNLVVTKGEEGAAGKACSAAFFDQKKSKIFLFGGKSISGRTNDLFSFDISNSTWEMEKPGGFIPTARSFMGSTTLENSLLIFGGQGRNDELLGGLHRFSNGKWAKIESTQPCISPRRQCGLVALEEKIYLIGGVDKVCNETGINHVLNETWIGKIRESDESSSRNPLGDLGLKRK